MEESLTLEELYLLLKVHQEGEYSRRKFAAALKGIDLDEEGGSGSESRFDEIRAEADAILSEQGQKPRNFGQDEVEDILGLNDIDDE